MATQFGTYTPAETADKEGEKIDISLESLEFYGDNFLDDGTKIAPKINTEIATIYCCGNAEKRIDLPLKFRAFFSVNEGHEATKFFINAEIYDDGKYIDSLEHEVSHDSSMKQIEVTDLTFNMKDAVYYSNKMTIKFNVSLEEGDNHGKQTGEYNFALYILLFKQDIEVIYSDRLHEKIFYFSCNQAKGLSNKSDVIKALWQKFENHDLAISDFDPNEGNERLVYYKTPHPLNGGWTAPLTKEKDEKHSYSGDCHSFACLFENVCLVQGISTKHVIIESKNGDEYFLIKNWHFESISPTQSKKKYPYINYYTPDGSQPDSPGLSNIPDQFKNYNDGRYLFVNTKEQPQQVIKGNTLVGQGASQCAPGEFKNHAISLIENTYYDASYGVKTDSIGKWAEQSIAGFFRDYGMSTDQTIKNRNYLELRAGYDSIIEVEDTGEYGEKNLDEINVEAKAPTRKLPLVKVKEPVNVSEIKIEFPK